MVEATKRRAREGIAAGVIAGVVFALAEVVAAAAMGMPALMPFRMFASIALGSSAMDTVPIGMVLVVGSIVHLVLSGIFGLIYGAANARASAVAQAQLGRQLTFGLLFGAALWMVNFQILARLLYPWFLGAPHLAQLVLHAVFYGLPLGLLYAGAERRARRIGITPATA